MTKRDLFNHLSHLPDDTIMYVAGAEIGAAVEGFLEGSVSLCEDLAQAVPLIDGDHRLLFAYLEREKHSRK